MGAIPWSPLARGRLTRPWSDEPPTARAESDTYARSLFARTAAIDKPVVERLHDVAHKRGLPSSQIALAWMLNNPAITAPIVGATKMQHLDGAVAALSVTLERRNRPPRRTLSAAFPSGSDVLSDVGRVVSDTVRVRNRRARSFTTAGVLVDPLKAFTEACREERMVTLKRR